MTPNSILDVFAKSPLKPLIEHMQTVDNCTSELILFLEAVAKQDWKQAKDNRINICTLEKEADSLKRKIRMRLPSGLFMPVDRADLLALLNTQDKIANKARDISGNIFGRKMVIPEEIKNHFINLYKKTIDCVHQANNIIKEFNNLLESGFSEKEINSVREMIYNLEKSEQETDEIQIHTKVGLLKIEKKINPIDAIFIYKAVDSIGDIADIAKLVGEKLEVMLIRA